MAVQFYLTDVGKRVALDAKSKGLNISITSVKFGDGGANKYDAKTQAQAMTQLVDTDLTEIPVADGKEVDGTLQLTVNINDPQFSKKFYEIGVMAETVEDGKKTKTLFAVASSNDVNKPLIEFVEDISAILTIGFSVGDVENVVVNINQTESIASEVVKLHKKELDPHEQYLLEADFQRILQALEARIKPMETRIVEDVPVGGLFITTVDYKTSGDVRAAKGYGRWEKFGDGKVLIAQSTSSENPEWTKTIGNKFGEYEHQLTIDEMPRHNHRHMANKQHYWRNHFDTPYVLRPLMDNNPTPKYAGLMDDFYIKYTGGDKPHNNVQPSIVVAMWKRLEDIVGNFASYFNFGISGMLSDNILYRDNIVYEDKIALYCIPNTVKISMMNTESNSCYLIVFAEEWSADGGYGREQVCYQGKVVLSEIDGDTKTGIAKLTNTKVGLYRRKYTAYLFNENPNVTIINKRTMVGYNKLINIVTSHSLNYSVSFRQGFFSLRAMITRGYQSEPRDGAEEYMFAKETADNMYFVENNNDENITEKYRGYERPLMFVWNPNGRGTARMEEEVGFDGSSFKIGVARIKAVIKREYYFFEGDDELEPYVYSGEETLKQIVKYEPFQINLAPNSGSYCFVLPFANEVLEATQGGVSEGEKIFEDNIYYTIDIYRGLADEVIDDIKLGKVSPLGTYTFNLDLASGKVGNKANLANHLFPLLRFQPFLSNKIEEERYFKGNDTVYGAGSYNKPVDNVLQNIIVLDNGSVDKIDENMPIYYKLFTGYVAKRESGKVNDYAPIDEATNIKVQSGQLTRINKIIRTGQGYGDYYYSSPINAEVQQEQVTDDSKLIVYVLFILGSDNKTFENSTLPQMFRNNELLRISVFSKGKFIETISSSAPTLTVSPSSNNGG